MPLAIRCDSLGKSYHVSRLGPKTVAGYRSLREDLMRWASAPLRWFQQREPAHDETFWALRDVGFEVRPGEVVGVIGRNGAGKSTLLKILSRITKPSTGQVDLYGRVGSLLEVGTGFHPELTGRENIFLNGAILGMRKGEIARKFDRIVDFAEIGPFLDTPVKRYSSGMYVRLAFAVAAHLEPEILIVDEVLAVGDMAFQRKCLGRMREVGRTGCTVLFVSHNMAAVETLCTRAILLDAGQIVSDGSVAELVREYHRRVLGGEGSGATDLSGRGDDRPLRSVTLLDSAGQPTNHVPLGSAFRLRIGFSVKSSLEFPTIGLGIDDTLGQRLLTVHTPLAGQVLERIDGRCQVECVIDPFPLAPGDYWLKLALSSQGQQLDEVEKALYFTVTDGDAFGEGRGFTRGICVTPSRWSIIGEQEEKVP